MASDIIILDSSDSRRVAAKKTFIKSVQEFFWPRKRLKLREKVVFFRILATMVNASLTVLKSFETLRKQEKNITVRMFYDQMIQNIQSGIPLNQWLYDYNDSFNGAEVSIIEAWEKTGRLNEALLQIADQTEKIDGIKRKVIGALTYPAVLIIAMVSVVTILMVKVIPALVWFFWEADKLPASTQMIMNVSYFFQNWWLWILLILILIVAFIGIWRRTKEWKYRYDMIVLKIPVIGNLIQKMVLSRFSRVFSNLLANGVSVVESIRIVSDAVDNEVYRQRLLLLREDVRNGIRIGEGLEDDPLFPDLLVQMMKVWEETARIDETVIKIAEFYDSEVDIAIESIQKLIEPIILFVMAGVIGLIALGIFEPIMSLANTITG